MTKTANVQAVQGAVDIKSDMRFFMPVLHFTYFLFDILIYISSQVHTMQIICICNYASRKIMLYDSYMQF